MLTGKNRKKGKQNYIEEAEGMIVPLQLVQAVQGGESISLES